MKTTLLFLVSCMLGAVTLAQSPFIDLGPGEKSLGDFRKLPGISIPQLRVGYELYREERIVVKESGVSAFANSLSTVGTDKNYSRQQAGIQTSSILDAGLTKEDFQLLTNEFHDILHEELAKNGVKVVSYTDMQGMKEYQALAENFGKKSERQEDKKEKRDLSQDRIYYLSDESIMIYNGEGVGHSVGTIVKLKKFVGASEAVMLLQNLDVDFCVIELDGKVEGGFSDGGRGNTVNTSTQATSKVLPIMNVAVANITTIGANGSISVRPIELKEPLRADNEYQAKLFKDKQKSENLFASLFSLKPANAVEFDPTIIQLSKEDFREAAHDLFRKYARVLAENIQYSQANKK